MTDPQPASSPEPLALPRTDALALSMRAKALTFDDPCRARSPSASGRSASGG